MYETGAVFFKYTTCDPIVGLDYHLKIYMHAKRAIEFEFELFTVHKAKIFVPRHN